MKTWDQINQAIRVERWENVLRVLENLTPHERREHWNMSIWGEKTDCGTVGCAAGHCGMDIYFRRRGFKLDFAFNKDCGDWATIFEDNDVYEFFGNDGTSEIFLDPTPRPVIKVIVEVKSYIKHLKSGATEYFHV